MRAIYSLTEIVIHCSANEEGCGLDINYIDRIHKDRDFKKQPLSGMYCGYNYVIPENGEVQIGRYLNEIAAHCKEDRMNYLGIGICYIGGLKNGLPADTRTPKQKLAIQDLVYSLKNKIPSIKKVSGHRDHSPDLDHNGIITKEEWYKVCPCFDVVKEFDLL